MDNRRSSFPKEMECKKRNKLLICHSALVDPEFGTEDGQLNNFNQPFKTIKQAIKAILKVKPSLKNRWVIYLSPCVFKENVKLYPFIDIHGLDRYSSIIEGTITSKLKITEEANLEELTIRGQLNFTDNLGIISVFESNIESINLFPILISGQVTFDSCFVEQTLDINNNNGFYMIANTSGNLIVRNTRHNKITNVLITPGIIPSSYYYQSPDINSEIISHSNLFVYHFNKFFNGLLIPYNGSGEGIINSQSDQHRLIFNNGAGEGRTFIPNGAVFNTGFVLARKIGNVNITIHSPKIVGIPDSLQVISTIETIPKAKVKHPAWVGLKDIPASFTLIGNALFRTDRSLIGAATDNKLFVGRAAYEVRDQSNNVEMIPDNVGVFDATISQSIIQLPATSEATVGQVVTIRFTISGSFTIQASKDSTDPNFSVKLQDLSISSKQTFDQIAYFSVPTFSPAPAGLPIVFDALQVQFTSKLDDNKGIVWTGVTTSQPLSANRLTFGPGNQNIAVPAGAVSVYIEGWSGGGAGGDVIWDPANGSMVQSGSGGGSGSKFIVNLPITFTRIIASIGKGGQNANDNGEETKVEVGSFTFITGPGLGGKPAPSNGNAQVGGDGGIVTITPSTPPGTQTFNGMQGGGNMLEFNTTAQGLPGQDLPPFMGGQGGSVPSTSQFTAVAGTGGGAAGPSGNGASGCNFGLDQLGDYVEIGGCSPAQPSAGGAGQGPDVPERQNNVSGGNGGLVVIFS